MAALPEISVREYQSGICHGILALVLLGSLSIEVLAQDPPRTAATKRPGRHPDFVAGFKAFKREEWKTVVIEMWKAHQNWPEDGERTRAYGRWPEPYLPRYYVGVALFELGCYKEALGQLNQSLLSQREIDGAKEEFDNLVDLKEKSENYVQNDTDQVGDEDCPEWRSWVENPQEDENENS